MKPLLHSFFSKLLAVGLLLSYAIGLFNPKWRGRLLFILLPKFQAIESSNYIHTTKALSALTVTKVIMLIDKVEDWDLVYPALEELEEIKTRATYVQSLYQLT